MATALDRIIDYKRGEVDARKASVSLSLLEAEVRAAPPPRGFAKSLARVAATGENALICELKRKSPSAGEILPGADPMAIATEYETGGAACLSILTDGPSFGGNLADLQAVRATVGLPLLRKDFMIDTWQVTEARAYGADAILVILAAVDDALAQDLCAAAHDYEIDVLAEVHNQAELDRALLLPADLLGINNRNLKTMTTDLSVTEALSAQLMGDTPLVSESGIAAHEDITRLRAVGARRFLIGESLMKQNDRRAAVSALRRAGTV